MGALQAVAGYKNFIIFWKIEYPASALATHRAAFQSFFELQLL
jgi:hypothetical protein